MLSGLEFPTVPRGFVDCELDTRPLASDGKQTESTSVYYATKLQN